MSKEVQKLRNEVEHLNYDIKSRDTKIQTLQDELKHQKELLVDHKEANGGFEDRMAAAEFRAEGMRQDLKERDL